MSEKYYYVTWSIELDATSPEVAAEQALEIQRDPTSIATVFVVTDADGVETVVDTAKED
jgi:hypothetical protein